MLNPSAQQAVFKKSLCNKSPLTQTFISFSSLEAVMKLSKLGYTNVKHFFRAIWIVMVTLHKGSDILYTEPSTNFSS